MSLIYKKIIKNIHSQHMKLIARTKITYIFLKKSKGQNILIKNMGTKIVKKLK